MIVQRFLLKSKSQVPFSKRSGAYSHGYSLPLQRVITDFAADAAFNQVIGKLEEHYGISVPSSSIQKITKKHAKKISEQFPSGLPLEAQEKADIIVAETDGTMVPIVRFQGEKNKDKRKQRTVCWKEARLSFGRKHQSIQQLFAATLKTTEDAGNQLLECSKKSGMSVDTYIHCVGDGAPWIRKQVNRVFAHQGTYLIDFYHLSEYLSGASEQLPEGKKKQWLSKQKRRMKNNDFEKVLDDLQQYTTHSADNQCPMKACFRYITNCKDHLDYKGTQAKELPIGSGEIESSHRTIIQKRLKIPGAWWLPETAEIMLDLRCARANGIWETYWNQCYDQRYLNVA